jgi:hypothetical protein
LITKSEIITPNLFSEEYLFQIINSEREERIKITVQTVTIIEFEGAHPGRLIELYHSLPVSTKYETADAVMIAKSGIKKKFGFILDKSPYPKINYRHSNKKRISS